MVVEIVLGGVVGRGCRPIRATSITCAVETVITFLGHFFFNDKGLAPMLVVSRGEGNGAGIGRHVDSSDDSGKFVKAGELGAESLRAKSAK